MRSHLTHFIVALAVATLSLAGYWFWYSAIATKSGYVVGLQSEIDARTAAAGRATLARSTLADIAGDEALVRLYFVPETSVVAFIDNVQARGSAFDASVSVSSVEAADADSQPVLIFTLVVRGSFDAVMRTLGSIEYAPYYLSISELALQKGEGEEWHANVKLRVGSVPAATSTPSVIANASYDHV